MFRRCVRSRHIAPCFGRYVALARSSVRVARSPASALVCALVALEHVIYQITTLVDGYLGMSNDEERSEMRYVVRIAEFSESSNL